MPHMSITEGFLIISQEFEYKIIMPTVIYPHISKLYERKEEAKSFDQISIILMNTNFVFYSS